MPVEFDSVNKLIKITSPTTEIGAIDIYRAAMEWADDQAFIDDEVPMAAYGKFPMGGGVYSDIIFVIQNDYKIKPWSGNYQLVIFGTIITSDESPRTVLPDFGNVEVVFQVCSQGTIEKPEWEELMNPMVVE